MKKAITKTSDFIKRWYKHLLALPSLMLLVLLVKLFNYSANDPISDKDYRDYFVANYKVFSITVPKDLNFCGEQVPLEDFTVYEAAEKELLINTYWQSQSMMIHKRAARWLPIIEPIIKKHNLPDDLKYIAIAESGLQQVVSPKAASGFWQFLDYTGKHYGLEISEDVDERYHVEKATEAACRYFKEAYAHYGNWTLVAASYNLGMGAVDKQLEKQKTNSYYDLYLNDETARYIFRVLAFKEIISRPKMYGYAIRKKDLYSPIPVRYVEVDSTITDLVNFSIQQGSSYKVLKYLNPWLLRSSLSNPGKKVYRIAFPLKGTTIPGLEDEPVVVATSKPDTAKYLTKSDVLRDSSRTNVHLVHSGETWTSIAEKYHVSETELLKANNKKASDVLNPGDKVLLPTNK